MVGRYKVIAKKALDYSVEMKDDIVNSHEICNREFWDSHYPIKSSILKPLYDINRVSLLLNDRVE